MNQITNKGKYCNDCFCKAKIGVIEHWCRLFPEILGGERVGSVFKHLRLPECLKSKPQILPTAKFNHVAYGKLWEEISEDLKREGQWSG